MTLILEIAAGIVLGVVFLFVGSIAVAAFLGWVSDWSDTTKIIVFVILAVLVVGAFNKVFPTRRVNSDPQGHLESRAHFAARYKKANPDTANMPDEQLVKEVLRAYPEWCDKVEGGCP